MPLPSRRLVISHCSEGDFLDRFREDISSAQDEVIVLSPFLSKNKASHYYPAFAVATHRGLRVRVYARPKWEQPDSLKGHFDPVRVRLEGSGVDFHVRPGMHEKVGVIDGQVLWHGSLNPLSHSTTRESMLRIESRGVVREVLAALDLSAVGVDQEQGRNVATCRTDVPGGDANTPVAPRCPICSSAVRYFEEAGVWVCVRAPACKGVLSHVKQEIPSASDAPDQIIDLNCPLCDRPFTVRSGLRDRVACSNSSCGFELDERLSGWILRAYSN